jgi:hypothetical protein
VPLAILCTAAASWYLLGLGVTVGSVVYPSFALVSAEEWQPFHRQHSHRIVWAVGGAWIAQAIGLAWWLESGVQLKPWCYCAGGAALAVLLTAGWAVGIHSALARQPSQPVLRRLRIVHALRTACWLISSVAALVSLR